MTAKKSPGRDVGCNCSLICVANTNLNGKTKTYASDESSVNLTCQIYVNDMLQIDLLLVSKFINLRLFLLKKNTNRFIYLFSFYFVANV